MAAPDWRAPVSSDDPFPPDWFWQWRYTPQYIFLPGAGPSFEIPEAAGKWTDNEFNARADRPNVFIQADGDYISARWWMSPTDPGDLWPPNFQTRFLTFQLPDQSLSGMATVTGIDDNYFVATAWVPDNFAGRRASFRWTVYSGVLVPKSEPTFTPAYLDFPATAYSIAPTRRPSYFFFPLDSAVLWPTSLYLGYNTA